MYYIGLNEDTVQYSNYFERNILLNGQDELSYKSLYGRKIDYNDIRNFEVICKYYSRCIEIIKQKDKNAKFMLYNQGAVEFMDDTSAVVCASDVNLLKTLNNKPKSRELLNGLVNLIDYKYLTYKQITQNNLDKIFGKESGRYVVQQPVGFGGEGTFLYDQNRPPKLKKTVTYSVSEYLQNAVPVNNTFMISKNQILLFDGSIQIIKPDEQLLYDGFDFENYKKLPRVLQKNLCNQTLKIARKLRSLGYRGIGGVDYVIDSAHKIYFMEINPRFQASTKEIDRRLIKNNLPSIFELNYMSFYGDKFPDLKSCAKTFN